MLKSKHFIIIVIFLFFSISYSQGVIEYNKEIPVKFIPSEGSNKIFKNSMIDKIKPESTVQSYFFATDSTSLNNNFLEKDDYMFKNQKHFDGIKNFEIDKNYLTVLHKFFYKHNGNEMCFLNYIFKLENIDFTIPTNLSLIKKNNKWYIFQLGNQIKLNEILWKLKSCVISDLISINVKNNEFNELAIKTQINNSLDINKLYNELISWDDKNLDKYTLKKNNDCLISNKEVEGDVITSFLFDDAKIELLKDSQNKKLKEKLELDSFELDSRLILKMNNIEYNIVKYKEKEDNVFKYKAVEKKIPKEIEDFFFLFKNLDSEFIYNLFFQTINPKLNDSNYKVIYENTRGQLNCLNSSKLYLFLKDNKTYFSKYLIKK